MSGIVNISNICCYFVVVKIQYYFQNSKYYEFKQGS